MSYARGFPNAGHYYSNIVGSVELSCNFVVDSTNGNGLGVRSIKSNGYVSNVFMHTSATPGTGDNGIVNPNPAAGFVLVQMKQNFNKYIGGFSGFVSQLSGSNLTSVTAGNAYVITGLGTATAAQWSAKGLPPGLTATVGQSFIASATGTIGGSATVKVPGVTGIVAMEVVGDPNLSISNASIAANGGAWILVQLLGATNSSTTTLIPTAPPDGSVLGMSFVFDNSSVTVDGL